MLTQSSKEEPCVKKKRKWIRWVVLLLLAALLVLGFVRLNQQTKSAAYTEVTATEGDLTTYYNFDGLVRAPSIQTITAGEAGTVRTVGSIPRIAHCSASARNAAPPCPHDRMVCPRKSA